jgi:hypothetical protein
MTQTHDNSTEASQTHDNNTHRCSSIQADNRHKLKQMLHLSTSSLCQAGTAPACWNQRHNNCQQDKSNTQTQTHYQQMGCKYQHRRALVKPPVQGNTAQLRTVAAACCLRYRTSLEGKEIALTRRHHSNILVSRVQGQSYRQDNTHHQDIRRQVPAHHQGSSIPGHSGVTRSALRIALRCTLLLQTQFLTPSL